MSYAQQLAAFATQASYDTVSEAARQQLKTRVLDALGCALGAVNGQPIRLLRKYLDTFGGNSLCTRIGGGRTAPDRAAFYNSALVRYLDFNDSYLAKGETCHPSDNIGAVLAASEYAGRNGKDLLAALAAAYQVQCRLSDVAPVRAKGFDHTVQGSYALAAGISRALGLDVERTANAIAICGTAFNALRVTRTGALSHWKGLAYPNLAFACTHGTFLAANGITGPPEVFEGNKGFMDAIAGPFEIDWSKEDLERVTQTIVKKYNAEIHSQSALEGILGLRQGYNLRADQVARVDLDIFDVAFHIIGGGEEGSKVQIHTKEEADHSLPYMLAVALLDGQVMPEQYAPDRILRQDVQALLNQIVVRLNGDYTRRFPGEMACRLTVTLHDGRTLTKEKRDYEGFHTRPMQWQTVAGRFERLSSPHVDPSLQRQIIDAVGNLETIQVADLVGLLAKVKTPGD